MFRFDEDLKLYLHRERIPIVVASDTFTRADHAEMARVAAALDPA